MVHCPHCQSKNINGKKGNNKQNYLCRTCGKQFQTEYKNQGANPVVKGYVQNSLCRNCGITDIKKIFDGGCHQLSKPYILNTLVNYSKNLEIKPQKQHYKSLQIAECRSDEFCTNKWKAFAKILPKKKHKIGKKYTKAIEGNNNYIGGSALRQEIEEQYEKLVVF